MRDGRGSDPRTELGRGLRRGDAASRRSVKTGAEGCAAVRRRSGRFRIDPAHIATMTSRSCGSVTSCSRPPASTSRVRLGDAVGALRAGNPRVGGRALGRAPSGLARRWSSAPASRPPSRGADVVVCGTELVAEQARRLGTDPDRILITPTGVDLDVFADLPGRIAADARSHSDSRGRFVVGWVGSFRRFHALEQAIVAVAGIDDATLLLHRRRTRAASRSRSCARAAGCARRVHRNRLAP